MYLSNTNVCNKHYGSYNTQVNNMVRINNDKAEEKENIYDGSLLLL
jgi:hypothetical protein